MIGIDVEYHIAEFRSPAATSWWCTSPRFVAGSTTDRQMTTARCAASSPRRMARRTSVRHSLACSARTTFAGHCRCTSRSTSARARAPALLYARDSAGFVSFARAVSARALQRQNAGARQKNTLYALDAIFMYRRRTCGRLPGLCRIVFPTPPPPSMQPFPRLDRAAIVRCSSSWRPCSCERYGEVRAVPPEYPAQELARSARGVRYRYLERQPDVSAAQSLHQAAPGLAAANRASSSAGTCAS